MIPQLIWVDRDTAARELLDIANQHPALEVRKTALHILAAIRSSLIAYDIIKIAINDERNFWERRFAMLAFAQLPDNIFAPQFLNLLEAELKKRTALVLQYGVETPLESSEFSIAEEYFDAHLNIISHHPSNRKWFFQLLEQTHPVIAAQLYCEMMVYSLPDKMLIRNLAIEKLIGLVDQYPQLLDLYVVDTIYQNGNPDHHKWLGGYLEYIVELCDGGEDMIYVPWKWDALRDALREANPTLHRIFAEREARSDVYHSLYDVSSSNYHNATIWQHFEALSITGDPQRIPLYAWNIASDKKQHVLIRAVATHFLGQYIHQAGVIEQLCQLMLTADDLWVENFEPIRHEAGYALQFTGSVLAWEAIIETFFRLHNPDMKAILETWLAHLTDTLSGISLVIVDSRWDTDSPRLFGKLSEIDIPLPEFT